MLDAIFRDLMRNCIDFIEEETLIQTQVRKMGNNPNHTTVNQTPKFHPELDGEGIEYSWGCPNNFHRRLPIDEKKGKDNFCRSVKKATETENITTYRIRMFSIWAREYIMAYKLLHCEHNAAGVNIDLHSKIPVKKI